MTLDQRSLNIILANLHTEEINSLALSIAQRIAKDYKPQGFYCDDFGLSHAYSERMVLALFFRRIFLEIKVYGHIKHSPESILYDVTANFDRYWYRRRPIVLDWISRAFTRQFTDLAKLEAYEGGGHIDWLIGDEGGFKRYSTRRFFIERVRDPSVGGRWPPIIGIGILESWSHYSGDEALLGLFNTIDEAQFALAQLIEVLNMDEKNALRELASQLVIQTLSQVSMEDFLMKQEKKAAEEDERLEEERIQREKEERKAAERAKILAKMCTDSHVYIFLFDNGFVKFGKGNNVFARANKIKEGAPISIIKWACTEPIHESQALKFESRCKKHFADKNIQKLYPERKYNTTENFEIPFEEAVEYLKSLTPIGHISDEPL